MIYQLNGTLAEINPSFAVVIAGGVGYKATISLKSFEKLSEWHLDEVTLHIHVQISEASQDMYGFVTTEEREALHMLRKVKGVGCGTAIKVLSYLSPEELEAAIKAGDEDAFKKVKGVGPKMTKQIIMDLSGEFPKPATEDKPAPGKPAAPPASKLELDAIQALQSLGYQAKEAKANVAAAIYIVGPDASLSELIKTAIKK